MRRKMTIGMFIFKVVLLVCFLLALGGELFQTCHRQWTLSGLEKDLPVNMDNMCPKCSKCFVANTKVPWTLKTMPAARSTVTSSSTEVDMTGASTSATVNDDLIPAENIMTDAKPLSSAVATADQCYTTHDVTAAVRAAELAIEVIMPYFI